MSEDLFVSRFHVLCVDSNAEFLELIQDTSESIDLNLVTCSTYTEAMRLSRTNYDGYLINDTLPDGLGIDIIRKTQNRNEIPVCVITDAHLTKTMYFQLKEKEGVDYILERPVALHHLKLLLLHIQNKINLSVNPPVYDLFQELREKYSQSTFDKIEELSQLVSAVEQNPTLETIANLQSSVHQLAGSAGSYGYPEISALCSQLESEMRKIEALQRIDKKWLDTLSDFIKNISFFFQIPKMPEAPKENLDGS